ncbi:UDP-glucose-4-epimerase [Kluyveromyces marxianus]|nr:UDP-glucose-4-epimerase [Kluyveromyces marxianus]KAG0681518.1 UDP-glucose-4-epimerase [Kluyveromyces marxianus]
MSQDQEKYCLVTGGAGYIGSHTVVELCDAGYKCIVVDNLCNSNYESISRMELLTGKEIKFAKIDLCDGKALDKLFDEYKIDSVLHFAGLKAVGESTEIPLTYYHNNIVGTLNLLNSMQTHGVKKLVFSSSATVYGDATRFENMIPIPEECPTGPTNPYGKTKLAIEDMMRDLHFSDKSFSFAILRYFNPIGAHPSGVIGEDPLGIPNNLLPYMAQVAIGRREKLYVFGNDYDTVDGTPIRDYIHVVDLAKGHLAALKYLEENPGTCREWNLGTGHGTTVFQMYRAFCDAIGFDFLYEVTGRRDGDVLNLTAKCDRATNELKWQTELDVARACIDLWKWTQDNPFGYQIKGVDAQFFGEPDDYSSRVISLGKGTPFEVKVANLGATIVDIVVNGCSVVASLDSEDEYKDPSNPFFGAIVGPYANRIAKGSFEIDGKKTQLTVSADSANVCHSGKNSYHTKKFLGPIVKNPEPHVWTADFLYVDEEDSEFPAPLYTIVKYRVDSENKTLTTEIESKNLGKVPTPANITNHTYFNLNKFNSPTIKGSKLQLIDNTGLEVTEDLLPTGNTKQYKEVATFKDEPTVLTETGPALDFDFISGLPANLDTRSSPLTPVFKLSNDEAKLALEVATTEPTFQVYTGDYVDVKDKYEKRAGICCEPGRYIDAVNNPQWKSSVILPPGETYAHKFSYTFKDL